MIPLNNILTIDEYNKFINLQLKVNDPIQVQGIVRQNSIFPTKIRTNYNVWRNDNLLADIGPLITPKKQVHRRTVKIYDSYI